MSAIRCDYLKEVRESVFQLAQLAFAEDLPTGDLTSRVLGLSGRRASAKLICREEIAMCGSAWYDRVVEAARAALGCDLELNCRFEDGTIVPKGSVLFELTGDAAALLGLERTLLNFLGRGIGIATGTRRFVEAAQLSSPETRILDTRKTLPGYRYFDKYAVLCGGGYNHRLNLSDQVLVKENHIAKFGGIAAVIGRVRAELGSAAEFVLEVESLEQLREALACDCPIIMLDNFTPAMVREACALEKGHSRFEVSGGIHAGNLADYAMPGLDRISIGSLTHSVKAPDLSLLVDED